MALTRTSIITLVQGHTGHSKDTLIDTKCDQALDVALRKHPFQDARSEPSDIAITEDATSIDISGVTGLVNVVTARIVEADGSKNHPLALKTRTWWDENVINPEDNMKGWPLNGLRFGTTMKIDRPAESGLELRLVVTTDQSFAADATACPIAILDTFVEYWVTAEVFAELEQWDSAKIWMRKAMGPKWEYDGTIGGELLNAINNDRFGDDAVVHKIERPYHVDGMGHHGVSVENLVTGHDDLGKVRTWY